MFARSFLSLTFLWANLAFADLSEASRNPRWLRLYQYIASQQTFKSAITSPVFFFAPNGKRDPLAEMSAAVQAYSNPKLLFGIQKQSAACVFPARLRVLEKLLKTSFPVVKCPDLDEWVQQIGADRARLVFVGAYAGNPASILGHTFLRLSNSKREQNGREGIDLLSYSVGFSAHAEPGDNRMTYMLKGLTGGYSGFYEIEPHYMKVGLYNNSESRDLWEVPLKLSAEETELLVLHLWELTFNASIDYYFIDENCSYRLLTWIEGVMPDLNASQRLSTVVLPSETVRVLIEQGLAENTPRFRASIRRRLEAKLARLSSAQKKQFSLATHSLSQTQQLNDAAVVDALTDYWIFENYRVKARLPAEQAAIMDAVFGRAAAVPEIAQLKPLSDSERGVGLKAPFEGHRARFFESAAGLYNNYFSGALRYRGGHHPLWSTDPAYAQVSSIEYLGADVEWRGQDPTRWNLLLVSAKSLDEGFGQTGHWSWVFSAMLGNLCRLCGTDQPAVQINGGGGLSHHFSRIKVYSLLQVKTAAWAHDGAQGVLWPGLVAGLKVDLHPVSFVAEGARHWWKKDSYDLLEGRLSWSLSLNSAVFVSSTYTLISGQSDNQSLAGATVFF